MHHPGKTLDHQDSDASMWGYKRETKHRIFVNRSLQLEKIKFFGFDMDYTLAAYNSPQFETLSFELIKQRLLDIGYPKEIEEFKYDSSFPVRGLWFDKEFGTLLKMDQFGNILYCIRGFRFLKRHEVRSLYPNKFLQLDESRLYVLNTLFNLPEMYMLACVVHWFVNNAKYTQSEKGVKNGTIFMSFRSMFNDVRGATDWIHNEGNLKQKTVENMKEYVHLDEKLPKFLTRLRSNGAKTFLLTNSGFSYTNEIMKYLLSFPNDKGVVPEWTSFFDYIVVDAQKPLFFKEGTLLRTVDAETGRLNIGLHLGPLEQGKIYSGGSCEIFSRLIGARGKDVLYVGDHIFGDILKSKKTVGWRTYLVIPELANEIYVWKKEKELFDRLQYTDNQLAEAYRDLNMASDEKPNVATIQKETRDAARQMEAAYGVLGSLFRNGSRNTFFSAQVMRYADIYSFSCLNLFNYPLCYMFRAPTMLMPHESTVSQIDSPLENISSIIEGPTSSGLCRRSRADVSANGVNPGAMQVELMKLQQLRDRSPPERACGDESSQPAEALREMSETPPNSPFPNDAVTKRD